jgi:hypothetical protein
MTSAYSGEGQALVVREKCNSLKPFSSSVTVTSTDDFVSFIINYENNVIGKKLLSGQMILINPAPVPINIVASDNDFNFNLIPFITPSGQGLIIYITGVFKKCNYSSREIQYVIPSATNKSIIDNFSSRALKGEELDKLLKSDPVLKKLYNKSNK